MPSPMKNAPKSSLLKSIIKNLNSKLVKDVEDSGEVDRITSDDTQDKLFLLSIDEVAQYKPEPDNQIAFASLIFSKILV